MVTEQLQSSWNFFRRTGGYTRFDHKRNEEILEELKVEPADEKLRRFKSNWLRHVTRMNNNRMPKIMLNYRPKWTKTTWKTLEEITRQGRDGRDDEAQPAALTPHSALASTEQAQGGLQSPSGCYAKEEVSTVPGNKQRFPDLPTCSNKFAYVAQQKQQNNCINEVQQVPESHRQVFSGFFKPSV